MPRTARGWSQIGFDELVSLGGFLSLLSTDEIEFDQIPVEDIQWEGLQCLIPLYNRTNELLTEVFMDNAPIAWRMEIPMEDGVVVEEEQGENESGGTD